MKPWKRYCCQKCCCALAGERLSFSCHCVSFFPWYFSEFLVKNIEIKKETNRHSWNNSPHFQPQMFALLLQSAEWEWKLGLNAIYSLKCIHTWGGRGTAFLRWHGNIFVTSSKCFPSGTRLLSATALRSFISSGKPPNIVVFIASGGVKASEGGGVGCGRDPYLFQVKSAAEKVGLCLTEVSSELRDSPELLPQRGEFRNLFMKRNWKINEWLSFPESCCS